MKALKVWGTVVHIAVMSLMFYHLFLTRGASIWKGFEFLLFIFLLLALLALIFLRFTIVDEGTAKLVVRLGSYKKTLLAKRGFKVDDDGEIVGLEEDEKPPFTLPGGLRFVGFWPLDKVYIQKEFDWIKINPDGTAQNRHEVNVNFILARDYVYGIRILRAEDNDLIPLNALLSVTAWIPNPSKAYLRGVQDWFRTLVGRVSPYVRKFIADKSYEDIQDTELEKEIIRKLENDGIIDDLKERYGIDVRKIEVIDINPGEKFRRLTVQKQIGRMNAQQAIEETAGRVLESAAKILGLTPDDLKVKLQANPKLRGTPSANEGFKEAFDFAEDQVKRDRAGEKGSLSDIRVGNTDGTSFKDSGVGTIIGSIAAIFQQKGKSSVSNKGKKKRNKDDDEDDDEDWDSQRLSEKK